MATEAAAEEQPEESKEVVAEETVETEEVAATSDEVDEAKEQDAKPEV